MSREATSEQLSIRKEAGYDEVFPLGHEPEEGFSQSSEREKSTQPSDEEMESYREKDKVVSEGEKEDDEEEGRESDKDESDSDEEVIESTSRGPGDDRLFILPEEWTVNDFLLTMSEKNFKTLRACFQILDNIPIRLLGKFEKCYTGKTTDVDMYDATFAAGLRLPLTALHRQLANFLGLSVNQITPNAWRIFIGAEILWGCLSGGSR